MSVSRPIILSSVFSMLLSTVAYGQDSSYEEAFIEVQVGSRGDSFYRVLVNENEDPYFPVQSFLKTWFDSDASCTVGSDYCSVELLEKEGLYWLSTESKEFGIDDKVADWQNNDDVIMHEGQLWISHKAWSQWLPMSSIWNKRNYRVAILPKFKLASVKLAELEVERIKNKKNQAQKLEYANQLPITPNDDFSAEGRVHLFSRYDVKNKVDNSYIDYDIGADLYRGTLSFGGDLMADDPEGYLGYWLYENKHVPHLDYLGLGDVLFNGSLIANPKGLENGFRVN